jgi:type VI secretion system protein ImpK
VTPSVLRSFRPLLETLSALALGQKAGTVDRLRPMRAELRQRLLALKEQLSGRVSDREAYLMLFAVVVHFDEAVRTSFPEADHATWPLLQKELFDTERGGELFYQSLGELLDGPKLAPVVYNIYYFCLSLGFRGKYAQEPERREQLMMRVRDWLMATAPQPTEIMVAADRPPLSSRVPRIHSFAWPWAMAGVLVVAIWVALSALAGATVARWRAADGMAAPSAMLGHRQAEVDSARPPHCDGGAPCRFS